MRPAIISAGALAATLSVPALAQDTPNAPVTPPATPGLELGHPQLHQAERRLQQATDQLQQAASAGDQEALERAKQEAQQALDAIQQAIGQLAPDRRGQMQQVQGGPESPFHSMRAEELVGRVIHGSGGEKIGEIHQVVVGGRGGAAAVVGVGGFLGIGQQEVAIPLDRLVAGTADRITTQLTRDQIESMDQYDASVYRPIAGSTTIGTAVSG